MLPCTGHLSLEHSCFCRRAICDASARVPLPLVMDAYSALAVLVLHLSAGLRPLARHQAVCVRLIKTFVKRSPLFNFQPSTILLVLQTIQSKIIFMYLCEIFFLRILLLRACIGCCANEAFLLRFVIAHTTKVSTPFKRRNGHLSNLFFSTIEPKNEEL